MPFCKKLNNYLERLLHPEVHILHRTLSAFKVLGYSGLSFAILLTMTLVTLQGLSPWVMTGIILSAVLTFLSLAMITKIITGEEQLIYYHHEIAIIITTAILLKLMNQPVLPYLDILILGIGLFLVFGRIGCLMVGCCHGLPHRCGISYGKEHAIAGFTHYFDGVRLFPIQAVESLWVLFVVITGCIFVLGDYPPGEAFSWYVMAYGVGRFSFEFLRGDPVRHYLFGFSEAQWTTLVLMSAVVWVEWSGVMHIHSWHFGATAYVVFTMIAVSLIRRFQKTDKFKLLHPHHVKEIAWAVDMVSGVRTKGAEIMGHKPSPAKVPISCTSLGIQISASKITGSAGVIYHYALSYKKGIMSEERAKILSRLILQIRHPSNSSELINGYQGVVHLIVHDVI